MNGIRITGTGSYLPDRVVTNEDFAAFLDTSDEWIVSHTGISQRRVAVDEPTWYMGAEAAKKALKAADLPPEQVDVIIGTTVTPDFHFPSMACLVQEATGAKNAFCYDIAAACAGFVYALDIARRYLQDPAITNILIVSAETLTQVTDFTDRSSCILFGDGAGACLVTRGEGVFGSHLTADGAGAGSIYAKKPRVSTPFGDKVDGGHHREIIDAQRYNTMVMDGHEVYRFATRAMPEAITKACAAAGLAPDDLDLILPHQANIRIIKAAMKNLGLSMDKTFNNIDKYGNTSSATVPISLDECVRAERLTPGDKVCAVGFGSGLVCGAAVFTV